MCECCEGGGGCGEDVWEGVNEVEKFGRCRTKGFSLRYAPWYHRNAVAVGAKENRTPQPSPRTPSPPLQ